jgi:hypothetical protein
MTTAVEQLQIALEAAHKPGINVLYGSGVQDLAVPPLTLRKVSGTDALRLIAVSAGCAVETIKGDRGDVIGYQIVSLAPAGGAAMYGAGGMTPVPGAFPISQPSRPGKSPTAAAATSATPGRPASEYPVAVTTPVASNAVIGFAAPSQTSPMVRVYSLGEITSAVKFGEVIQTLEDLLKASGISLETAKLAIHEKTNVLVVTGDLRVQELVGQLLDALQRNSISAATQNSRDENARLQKVELEMRLKAEADQSKRLQMRLEESEAQLTKLQRELDRVSHAAAPSQK